MLATWKEILVNGTAKEVNTFVRRMTSLTAEAVEYLEYRFGYIAEFSRLKLDAFDRVVEYRIMEIGDSLYAYKHFIGFFTKEEEWGYELVPVKMAQFDCQTLFTKEEF